MRISDWSSDVCSSDLIESAAVGLPFGVIAPIAGTLPVREASAPSGADAAPSAGKGLVAGADCDGGVPRGTPLEGAAEVAVRGGIEGRTVPHRLAGRCWRQLSSGCITVCRSVGWRGEVIHG